MRRFFSKSVASYLSLYVRPHDEVVETGRRSEGLGNHLANYRTGSSVEDLATLVMASILSQRKPAGSQTD